jgi:Bacterial archaeo-eukaryotic release factor family 2
MPLPCEVTRLYGRPGPFATAYLDATRTTELGAEQVRLRWQALRSTLLHAGADEATVAALDASAEDRVPGEHGRVLIGAAGETLLAASLPRPPLRPLARWAPLPHVMPYLAQQGPRIPHVVVLADREGADISTSAGTTTTVEGSHDYPRHKSSTADWSERHFQQRVENSWAANAREVAAVVADYAARIRAAVVLLAGEPKARGLLRTELPTFLDPDVEIVQLSEGSRESGASHQELDDAIQGVLLERALRGRTRVLDRLGAARGHGLAVTGVEDVVAAVRRAQVDTLVLAEDPSSTLHAWIGPQPLQLALVEDELPAMGVAAPQRDRLDAALVRALAGSDASLLTVPPDDVTLPDGIAALLRYTDEATPH